MLLILIIYDKLVEKIAGQQIVTSFYRNDAVISSLVVDVPDISDSDTLNFGKSNKDIVYKFLGTLVAIRMSLRKYYKPIVLHQVPITVRNGGYVFGRDIRRVSWIHTKLTAKNHYSYSQVAINIAGHL